MLALAYDAGLRREELCLLRSEDLDPSRRLSTGGILRKLPFGKKLTDYFGRYQSAQTHLNAIMSTPFLEGDHLYGVCSYGQLRCLKAGTGERVWETFEATTGGGPVRWANAFIVKNGGRFFLFNEKGDLIIAKLSPKGYEEVSRAHLLNRLVTLLPDVDRDTIGQLRAHHLPLSSWRPVAGQGRLLLAGDALSLVNPFTGEGIFYAVVSGTLAGTAAAAGPRTREAIRGELLLSLLSHYVEWHMRQRLAPMLSVEDDGAVEPSSGAQSAARASAADAAMAPGAAGSPSNAA